MLANAQILFIPLSPQFRPICSPWGVPLPNFPTSLLGLHNFQIYLLLDTFRIFSLLADFTCAFLSIFRSWSTLLEFFYLPRIFVKIQTQLKKVHLLNNAVFFNGDSFHLQLKVYCAPTIVPYTIGYPGVLSIQDFKGVYRWYFFYSCSGRF